MSSEERDADRGVGYNQSPIPWVFEWDQFVRLTQGIRARYRIHDFEKRFGKPGAWCSLHVAPPGYAPEWFELQNLLPSD